MVLFDTCCPPTHCIRLVLSLPGELCPAPSGTAEPGRFLGRRTGSCTGARAGRVKRRTAGTEGKGQSS